MEIKEFFQNNKMITDGAFGTYFATIAGEDVLPEQANTENPELVYQVHKAYLEAGANLIRTNTFASNETSLHCSWDKVEENIRKALQIAKRSIFDFCENNGKEKAFLFGDIGPVLMNKEYDEAAEAEVYCKMCDIFLEEGVDGIVFETFSHLDSIKSAITSVKEKNPAIFIITQFSVNQLGYTNAGLSARSVLAEVEKFSANSEKTLIDAAGFNCGVGPAHLYQILKGLKLPKNLYITALPNASYPKIIQNRIVFMENMEYFADKMTDIAAMGVDIVGGCCGTNPGYIQRLKEKIEKLTFVCGKEQREEESLNQSEIQVSTEEEKGLHSSNAFFAGKEGKKLIAVELAPPPNAKDEKIMEAAHLLEQYGVDTVTFPDSPSGRTRADSVLMAAKVAKETNLCVMPHVCCRDKNAIAIRSQLLGAHINNIRNMLIITGDPVPSMVRSSVKGVFNFDSVGFMKIVKEMNTDEFLGDSFAYGGAINHNRRNIEVEIGRIHKKMEAGAEFFFTQPVFSKNDVEILKRIKAETGARILCGIMPLVSLKNATFIKNEMTGIHVTDDILAKFRPDMTKEEGEAVGVTIAKEVMEMTKDVVDGYYFTIPFNRVYLLKEIL